MSRSCGPTTTAGCPSCGRSASGAAGGGHWRCSTISPGRRRCARPLKGVRGLRDRRHDTDTDIGRPSSDEMLATRSAASTYASRLNNDGAPAGRAPSAPPPSLSKAESRSTSTNRAQRSYTVLQTDPRLLGQRFGVCAAVLAVPLGSSSAETASTSASPLSACALPEVNLLCLQRRPVSQRLRLRVRLQTCGQS